MFNFYSISPLQLKYKETFNAEKGHYIGSDDTPQLAHCREVSKNISEVIHYKAFDLFCLLYNCDLLWTF